MRWLRWKTRTKKAFMLRRDSTLVRTHTHDLESLDEFRDAPFSRHFEHNNLWRVASVQAAWRRVGTLPSALNAKDWIDQTDLLHRTYEVLCLPNPSFSGLGKQGPWFHEARLIVCAKPLLQSPIRQSRFVCVCLLIRFERRKPRLCVHISSCIWEEWNSSVLAVCW